MAAPHPLDNPIWSALQTEHVRFALGNSLAARYLPDIGPLSAVCHPSPSAYDALRGLAAPGEALAVFLPAPPDPQPGWSLQRSEPLDQMIFQDSDSDSAVLGPSGLDETLSQLASELDPLLLLRRLTAADVPAMHELAALTEPGPFRQRTCELGCFWGVFKGESLLGMAGQRLQLPHFVEVSAVCTHPNARGRGLARLLVRVSMLHILRRGRTPFLHVLPGNEAAIRVYRALGFVLRRDLHLAVFRRESY
jgi:GNAT superfamily N-acetyltransferase